MPLTALQAIRALGRHSPSGSCTPLRAYPVCRCQHNSGGGGIRTRVGLLLPVFKFCSGACSPLARDCRTLPDVASHRFGVPAACTYLDLSPEVCAQNVPNDSLLNSAGPTYQA